MELADKELKSLFEIFNNMWLLVKPYVEDEKPYKKIMSDIFYLTARDRGDKYTEKWWDSTRDLWDYPERYKGTEYVEFATNIVISLMNYWQYASRNKATHYDFMVHIGKAFVNEWERLKNG